MTLIEVVIALALFSLIAVFTASNTSVSLRLKEKLSGTSDYYHNVRTALRHFERDISLAFHSSHDTKLGEYYRQQNLEEEAYGTQNLRPYTFFYGDKDRLLFSTSAHQRKYKDVNETDIVEVEYYLEQQKDMPGVYDLYKRHSGLVDNLFEEGWQTYVIASGIESMKFRYLSTKLNNGEPYWVDKWYSNEGDFVSMFPQAVELDIVFSPIAKEQQKLRVLQKIKILNPNNIEVELGS